MVHITDAIIQHKSTKMVSRTVAHYRIGDCTRPTLRGANAVFSIVYCNQWVQIVTNPYWMLGL